jgi:hypothetical protein
MYYEILVNGTSLGVVGHDNVRNMHLSVLVMPEGQDVFASAVCEEDGSLFHYSWLQHSIGDQDKVEIRRAEAGPSIAPQNKYRMKGNAKEGGSSPPNNSLERTREG